MLRVILGSACFLLASSLANAESSQTLVIDSKHLLAGKNERKVKSYTIKPTKKLVIDYTNYKFIPGSNGKINKPDTMSMIVDSKRQYFYKITNSKTKHMLSANTLTHREGFKPFDGLKSGDKFILAIGNLELDKANDKHIFKVAWIGVVKVTK